MPKNSNLLSHQATLPPIGVPFIELPTVDSTNNYAMAMAQKGMANHGTTFFAHEQTAGKGQRGKMWAATSHQNIMLSVVLEPGTVSLSEAFLLSAATALACYDLFKKYAGHETKIKWPNDIYWRDRKAGGILIENLVRNDKWKHAIVGIGININQTAFPPHLINPVSLKQITNQEFSSVELAKELCMQLQGYYHQLQSSFSNLIISDYNRSLYKLGEIVKLKKKNIVFETTVKGVSPAGRLLTNDTMEREFDFGDIEWALSP